jgi:hypothetical protein
MEVLVFKYLNCKPSQAVETCIAEEIGRESFVIIEARDRAAEWCKV